MSATPTTAPDGAQVPGAVESRDVLGAPLELRRGRWLHNWNPEDPEQWESKGRSIARRNLIVSIFAEFLGFCAWAVWSIVVPQLPAAGFALTIDQMFWLVALPALVGATLRIPYTFAVPVFGGRNWTIVSALLLLVPVSALIWVVQRPETSFGVLLAVAALAGFGGGNFASSMANISFFYPEREKGRALGLNAAGGNIGTAAVQLAVPLVIITATGVALERAGLVFIPLIVIAAAAAFFLMDNVTTAKSDPRAFAVAGRNRHTWIISFIYIGTFGSFIGFSGAFPTLLKSQFPEVTLAVAFLGALVGSVSRPWGGSLADKLGGARVTIWSFVVMAGGSVGAVYSLRAHSFWLFLGSFLVLFVATGVGNGSVYRMIPAVFRHAARSGEELASARRAAAGCLGIAGAVGAFGGFLIPRGFATSNNITGGIEAALWGMVVLYGVMLVVTWVNYARRGTVFGDVRI